MASWQVQEAKSRFSEVIERARTEGPQTITRHGAERAVVISIEDYHALSRTSRTSRLICWVVPRSTILRLSVTATPAVQSSCERNGWLSLDTNVISETRKIRADAGVMAFLAAADAAGLFMSVLPLGSCAKVSRLKGASVH